MPDFDKSPAELIDFFNMTMQAFPQAQIRKTFGYPCAYINGHMASGLYADLMFIRLSPSDEQEFLKIPAASSFSPMKNRPMKGYVVIPTELAKSKDLLQVWISRSFEFVSNLPPKEKKPARKRT